MQILHLGLHKTGTTSLQKNLFPLCKIPYQGMHSPDWQACKNDWLDFFTGKDNSPLPSDTSFIYSYEATLLRSGGLESAGSVAQQIARSFSNPTVLITVREPSALLISAYFQSLRLRRSALGFRNGEPVYRQSVRFMPFEEWWERLDGNTEISLAGLLDFERLRAEFESWLAPEQIVFLKLEALRDRNPAYLSKLRKIGCPAEALENFFSAPAENSGSDKKLLRERAALSRLGWQLTKPGLSYPLSLALRATGLMRPAEKIIYGGKAAAQKRISVRVLQGIQERYRPGYDALV